MTRLVPHKRHVAWAAFVIGLAVSGWLALTSSTLLRVVAGLILAAMLFYLRKTHKMVYGAIEVIAGMAALAAPVTRQTCGTFAESCQPIPTYVLLVGTLAGIYILIRGFDNFEQGWRQHGPGI
jgi:chromate transport protein ChrA